MVNVIIFQNNHYNISENSKKHSLKIRKQKMKNNLFHLKILTSKGVVFGDDISSIYFENEKGNLTFLKDHAPDGGLIKKSNCLIVEKDNNKTTLFHSD